MIEVAAERNPDKYGAYTIGTEIPIVSEVESRAMNPDYYLVLPWHFKQEIVEREKEMLNKVSNWGHAGDRVDWKALVEEEYSRPFNGKDFLHNYQYQIVDNKFNIK